MRCSTDPEKTTCLLIMIGLIFVLGCDNTSATTPIDAGKEGGACLPDESCLPGLICSSIELCVADVSTGDAGDVTTDDATRQVVGDVTDPCIDDDGDGYGVDCAQGVDCDDNDNTVWHDCSIGHPGEFVLGATIYTALEDAGTVEMEVRRVRGSLGEVGVAYSTRRLGDGVTPNAEDQNFNAPGDYLGDYATLSFADGVIAQTISVTLYDDSDYEGDEVFEVYLLEPTGGATLGSPAETTATVTILDDETLPVDPCASVACTDHSHCDDGVCVCDEGYVGTACDPIQTGGTTDLTAILHAADFNSGVDGATVGMGTSDLTYAATPSYGDSGFSGRTDIAAGQTGFGTWGFVWPFPDGLSKGDEVWVRIRTYVPAGTSLEADPWLKFFRIHTKTPAGDNLGYDDMYLDNVASCRASDNTGGTTTWRFIYEGQQLWQTAVGTCPDNVRYDVWETYELYLYLDNDTLDDGGQATFKWWKDGILLDENHGDIRTLKFADTIADAFYFLTYFNGSAPSDAVLYVDDFAVAIRAPSNGRDDTPHMATDPGGFPYIGP